MVVLDFVGTELPMKMRLFPRNVLDKKDKKSTNFLNLGKESSSLVSHVYDDEEISQQFLYKRSY